MTAATVMRARWYPITDSAGNFCLDDPERSGTLIDDVGVIHNGVPWADARDSWHAERMNTDVAIVVDNTQHETGGKS